MLGRAVSFLMLPVYTRYPDARRTTASSQLLDLTVDVAAIFFTAGATSGVQRFYFKTSRPGSSGARLLSTTFFLVLGSQPARGDRRCRLRCPRDLEVRAQGGRPAVVTSCSRPPTSRLGMLIDHAAQSVAQTTQRARLLLSDSRSSSSSCSSSLNILFVVVLRARAWPGCCFGTLSPRSLLGGSLAVWLLRQTGIHFDWRSCATCAVSACRTSSPGPAASCSPSVTGSSCRPARASRRSGLYGMAYQFGFLLSAAGRHALPECLEPAPAPAGPACRRRSATGGIDRGSSTSTCCSSPWRWASPSSSGRSS